MSSRIVDDRNQSSLPIVGNREEFALDRVIKAYEELKKQRDELYNINVFDGYYFEEALLYRDNDDNDVIDITNSANDITKLYDDKFFQDTISGDVRATSDISIDINIVYGRPFI